MANAVEVDIAEAIKDELNAHDFGITFRAERSEADASTPLTDLGAVHVDVIPWLPQPELDARGTVEYTVQVDVLIRKRFEASEQSQNTGLVPISETDRLRKLRQDITEYFLPCEPAQSGRRLTAITDATIDELKVMSGMVRPHMKQYRQFTAWLRLTYLTSRTIS